MAKAAEDIERLIRPLLQVFDEIAAERGPLHASGPSLGDSINAQLLAGAFRRFGVPAAERSGRFAQFFEAQPALFEWTEQMLADSQSRENLKRLLRIELNK